MKLSTDLKDGSVSTELSWGVYARESLRSPPGLRLPGGSLLEEKPRAFAITLEAKKRTRRGGPASARRGISTSS